ncbi:hypothetical protein ACIBQ1_40100 [Nonomuraea sp. NPDC050153]|uniref:hypothetical protein n=1 Tax=Nonomuraea sp. NPDC050153 TaxID=3364359 RepID=UPI00379790E6
MGESRVLVVHGAPGVGKSALLQYAESKAADAHALLNSVTHVRIDQHIRDRFVAETRGNPLALLELPREPAVTRMAGGFGLLDADTLPGRAAACTA